MASKQIGGLTAGTPIMADVIPKQIADASTEAEKVTFQQVSDLIKPYTVYTALLTQTGSSIPTAVELENTLGALTFTRSSTGTYTIASSGLFTTGQVWASPKWSTLRQGSNYATVLLSLANVNQLTLTTYLDGVAADALLTDFPIEIRVYL